MPDRLLPLLSCALLIAIGPAARAQWSFLEVGGAAGVGLTHDLVGDYGEEIGPVSEQLMISGGAAVGDYDGDGLDDVFLVRGDHAPNALLRNAGGSFVDATIAAGLASTPSIAGCAVFADMDGDGDLDLFVGGVAGHDSALYRNRGDATFEAVASPALEATQPVFGIGFGDLDGDGDLDAATASWIPGELRVWRNDGAFQFVDTTTAWGLNFNGIIAFAPTAVDLDGDRDLDLLVTGDFGTSEVLRNVGGAFQVWSQPAITDENGMGGAVGDIDGDGDLDWLVTSIWDPDQVPEANWGVSGNRMYRNVGGGALTDATDATGVRQGYWGWGACLEDLDNDGRIDAVHTNGFPMAMAAEFHADPLRLFVQDATGAMPERSVELGMVDTGQGRALLCFDYDADGDLDVLVHNHEGTTRLFRNDGGNASAWLRIKLVGPTPNPFGIGAHVRVRTGSTWRLRHIQSGGHFAGGGPPVAHFGLGSATQVDEVIVDWPDGSSSAHGPFSTSTERTLVHPSLAVPLLPYAR